MVRTIRLFALLPILFILPACSGDTKSGASGGDKDSSKKTEEFEVLPPGPPRTRYTYEQAIAKVKALGGSMRSEPQDPKMSISRVTLNEVKLLPQDLDCLHAFPDLIGLSLMRSTVTDIHLVRLQGLTKLNDLTLRGTAVTDRGVANLRDLPGLRHLNVLDTEVTASGLKALRRLNAEVNFTMSPSQAAGFQK